MNSAGSSPGVFTAIIEMMKQIGVDDVLKLKDDFELLKQDNHELYEDLTKKIVEIQKMNDKVSQKDIELEELNKDLRLKDRNLQDRSVEVQLLRTWIDELADKLIANDTVINTLTHKNDSLDATNKELNNQLLIKNDKIDEMNIQLSQSEKKSCALQRENESMKSVMKAYMNKLKRTKNVMKENEILKKEIVFLKSNNKTMPEYQEQQEEQRQQYVKLQEKLKLQTDRLSKLSSAIKTKDSELSDLRLANSLVKLLLQVDTLNFDELDDVQMDDLVDLVFSASRTRFDYLQLFASELADLNTEKSANGDSDDDSETETFGSTDSEMEVDMQSIATKLSLLTRASENQITVTAPDVQNEVEVTHSF